MNVVQNTYSFISDSLLYECDWVLVVYRLGRKTSSMVPGVGALDLLCHAHNLNTTEAELVVAKCGFIPEKVSMFFCFQLHDSIIYSCEYSRTTTAIQCHTLLRKVVHSGLE